MMQTALDDRQSGRTTLVMREALAYSRNGSTPVYVIHSRHAVGYFRRLWEHLGGEPRALKIMTPNQEFRGLAPESIFIDHHVFEVGFYNPGLESLIRGKRALAGEPQ